MINKTSSFLTRSFCVVNGEEFEVEVEHTLGEEYEDLAEGLGNYPPAGLGISIPVEIAPESDIVLQELLADLARDEAEIRAKRAAEIISFFNDVKKQSLHNEKTDYRKLLADVREFIKAVNELGIDTGVDTEKRCIYLKNAAITGLTILAEHRPDKHAQFPDGLMLFCQAGYATYAANWFKGALWGDLFVWASFFEQLMDCPPAGFDIKELNDTEIFVNFLILACLSRVGHGL